MGNCLKGNKVEPFEVRDNATEMLARGSPNKRSAKSKHADMIQSLMEEGKTPNVAKDGLSFVVDFSHGTKKGKKGKKPPNIGKKANAGEGGSAKDPGMEYSAEEKALMVEIMREDILKEKKEKARNIDIKILDAKRKRMGLPVQAESDSKVEQEKILKAEAAREGKLKEKKDKARQAELDAFDVEMRKLLEEAEAEFEERKPVENEVSAADTTASAN